MKIKIEIDVSEVVPSLHGFQKVEVLNALSELKEQILGMARIGSGVDSSVFFSPTQKIKIVIEMKDYKLLQSEERNSFKKES